MTPVVFIHRISREEECAWLQAFAILLPNENILLAEQLSDQQKSAVKVAIVANPDPETIAELPNLVWIQSLWAGVEALVENIIRLQQRGMHQNLKLVRLVDPQLARSMSEAVLAWTLYLHRLMPEYARQQQQRKWQPLQCPRAENTRVSVLGAGELGRAAIKTLLRQGYNVSSWRRSEKYIEGVTGFHGPKQLPEILKQSDIVVCLLPLTAQTHGILAQPAFEC
jgi:glyoxylate/hydroxypyruvate reductase A